MEEKAGRKEASATADCSLSRLEEVFLCLMEEQTVSHKAGKLRQVDGCYLSTASQLHRPDDDQSSSVTVGCPIKKAECSHDN